MTTTISGSDGTKQLLTKHTFIPSSLYGEGKHMKPWSKKDRMGLHEL